MGIMIYMFCTVQPDGIPLSPVVQSDIDDDFTNVPDDPTPNTQ